MNTTQPLLQRAWNPCAFLLMALFCALMTLHVPVAAQIVIGQSTGLTGAAAAGSKENTIGANLYIDHINAKGGVNGEKIRLVTLDDQFDPKRTADNAARLITDHGAIALFLTRGTPHSQAVLPLLSQHKVPLVAPATGAIVMHQPVNPWVFNVRSSYQREAFKAIEHLATVSIRRIGVVHTDDSFGQDGMKGIYSGFQQANLQPAFVIKLNRDNPDYAELTRLTKQTEAQAVVFVTVSGAVVDGTRAIRAAGAHAQIVALSVAASSGFIQSMGNHAPNTIVTQVFPSERALAVPFIKQAHDLAMAKGLTSITPTMLEGFAAAKVLVEGLRRAGPKPTGVALQRSLDSLNRFDLGGLELSYSETDHTGLELTDISIVTKQGRFLR